MREYVIQPFDGTPMAGHCFAVAMLVFAAIDGLGRLIHASPSAGAGMRFKEFLPRLGDDYSRCAEELWFLRNSLAHNAINVASYLSATQDAARAHLEVIDKHLLLHTGRLLEDFRTAVDALEADLQRNPPLFARTESRLEFVDLEVPGNRFPAFLTTAPPFVRFRCVRER